jgi:hypothetical protein
MKGSDRFLITLVAGVVILVIAVFAIARLRPNQPDDTPPGLN